MRCAGPSERLRAASAVIRPLSRAAFTTCQLSPNYWCVRELGSTCMRGAGPSEAERLRAASAVMRPLSRAGLASPFTGDQPPGMAPGLHTEQAL